LNVVFDVMLTLRYTSYLVYASYKNSVITVYSVLQSPVFTIYSTYH